VNVGETAALLAVITDMWATLTPRTEADAKLRVQNWAEALDADMPHDFAVRVVHRRFGTPGAAEPTPGDLNAAWRARKREESYARQRRLIAAGRGVKPTQEFRRALEQLKVKNQTRGEN
jgi:hypothetical protein